jgi:haloalkane dehalogenase
VRNPIYLAALLIVLEEAWLFMSQALLAYAAAMAVLFHLFITGYEQPTLRSRFGSTYLEYQRPVIPSVSNEPMIATLARVTANHPVPSFGRRKVRRWDGHDGGGGDRRASSGGPLVRGRRPGELRAGGGRGRAGCPAPRAAVVVVPLPQVIPELAARGFRAMSFDLPGLGLADRPVDFDFTFAGLGRFAEAAVDALGLERFHLVVHDAGGPVGFELAASAPERVRSLTILNTVVTMDAVPFPMEVYAGLAVRRGWAALPPPRVSRALIYAIGISDRSAVTPVEIDAYRDLVVRVDGGAAYLEIMRNLRRGARDHRAVVDSRSAPYPVQVIWGAKDPILPLRRHGWKAMIAAGVPSIHTPPPSTSCKRITPPSSAS